MGLATQLRVAAERTSKPHEFWAKNQPKRSYKDLFEWSLELVTCFLSGDAYPHGPYNLLQMNLKSFSIILTTKSHHPSIHSKRLELRSGSGRRGSTAEVVHQGNLLIFPVLGSSGRLSSCLNHLVIQYAFYKEISSEIYTTKNTK